VPPAGDDAAQPVDGDVQGGGEQVVGGAVLLGAQLQPGDVPVGDLECPGVVAAWGCCRAGVRCLHGFTCTGPALLAVTGMAVFRQPGSNSGNATGRGGES
jgi:hypothetical protein